MLSTTSEYAIRALVFVFAIEKDTSVLGKDLAELSGIPSNYLAKILLSLKKAGFVEATRGPGGGYKLKRNAEHINLMEVVRTIDGEMAVPGCILQHKKLCQDVEACSAHHLWRKVKDAYVHFLENTTVASLATNLDNIDLKRNSKDKS